MTFVAGGVSVSEERQSAKAVLHNSAVGLHGPDHTTRPSEARATSKKQSLDWARAFVLTSDIVKVIDRARRYEKGEEGKFM